MKSSLHFLPPFSSPSPPSLSLSQARGRSSRALLETRRILRAKSHLRTHETMSWISSKEGNRSLRYDWRARMWRPRLHMDGGHNRALACTWMRHGHGSLESGCSHACTPRRRTHPNFNSQHFFLVHAALDAAGVRGEGAGKEGLT
jgi:hypothetical protein